MPKTEKNINFRKFIPNLITILALCSGLLSIRASIEHNFMHAVYFIIFAVILDSADGRLARMLNAVSDFGAEIDSLSDFFNFGIAPGFLVYNYIFIETEVARIGFLAFMVLAISCALRLARFNVALSNNEEAQKKSRNYFVGVPAPAMGCLTLLPAYISFEGIPISTNMLYSISIYMIVVGILTVSTLPTFSIKHIEIKQNIQLIVLLLSVGTILCLLIFPWRTMIICSVIYLLSIPLAYWFFRIRRI